MSCKRYKKALIEAAASGKPCPNGAVSEHLNSCTGCGEFFAREQALFAAIDVSIRRISDVEIPASLHDGVQTALKQKNHARPWALPVLAHAVAAAAVVLVISVAQSRHQPKRSVPDRIAHVATPSKNWSVIEERNSSIQTAFSGRAHRVQPPASKKLRQAQHDPEVLVQPDEEVQLIRFYKSMQVQSQSASAAVARENEAPLKPLAIAAIEIAQLEAKNPFEYGDVSR